MSRAAAMYCSRCVGVTRSTSATLSKPSLAMSGGSIRARVDAHAEQILDGRRVLGAVQAVQRDAAGLRRRAPRQPRRDALERRDERVDLLGVRVAAAGRRHQLAAQLANDLFPDFRGCAATSAGVTRLERQLAGGLGVVVALGAVVAEHRPNGLRERLLGRLRARRRRQAPAATPSRDDVRVRITALRHRSCAAYSTTGRHRRWR